MSTQEFLDKAYRAASESGHIFPEFACCEAALESGWGGSRLAQDANNLFGRKARKGETLPTISINTREFIANQWVTVPAAWAKFEDWKASFADRMATLRRLAPSYPHYAAALAAKTGKEFVEEVSKTWSTDPLRAVKVLAIYDKHFPA